MANLPVLAMPRDVPPERLFDDSGQRLASVLGDGLGLVPHVGGDADVADRGLPRGWSRHDASVGTEIPAEQPPRTCGRLACVSSCRYRNGRRTGETEMPILLEAPTYKPGGPDGQGWNRLSLNAHMGGKRDQCALRPRSYAALHDSQDTRRARWGSFGRCTQDDGRCGTCPRFRARQLTMSAFTDRVLVRILVRTPGGVASDPVVELHLMNKPEDGWSSTSYRWTWDEIARLAGWQLDGQYRDKHSEGFWLRKVNPVRPDGLPDCTHGYLNRDHCRTCKTELETQP